MTALFDGDTPLITSGVEHEYKWLLAPGDLPEFGGGPRAVLDRLGPPAPYLIDRTAGSTVSSVLLDTAGGDLRAAGMSLAVILHHGPLSATRWLLLKSTLLWIEGRRDTLEIGERVPPGPVSALLEAGRAQPLLWLRRTFGRQLELRPYGALTQRRHQALVTGGPGGPLGISLDDATTRDLDGTARHTARWLEIEANQADAAGLRALAGWAAAITAGLGRTPHERTKPELVAELLEAAGAR